MDAHSSIRVRFTTDYDEYRVINTPLAVPCKLGRKGLSELINHLLQPNTSVSFDFIINGILLRSSLLQFLDAHKLSNEEVLTIQYIPSLQLPPESQSIELPSWIGCLNSNMSGYIVAGCYNGLIQVFDQESVALQLSIQAHQQGVRSVAVLADGDNSIVFSGSKDHSIQSYRLGFDDNSGSLTHHHSATLSGHASSVESLDVFRLNQSPMLVSGDWNGTICGWDVKALENSNAIDSSKVRKKRKLDTEKSQPLLDPKPMFTIKGHSQSVSSLHADDKSGRLFSCSWDHSLKEWDVERQECSFTFVGSKVITSLHFSSALDSVLTSHADGRVRLWDMRQREGGVCKLSFGTESKHWVSQVRDSLVLRMYLNKVYRFAGTLRLLFTSHLSTTTVF